MKKLYIILMLLVCTAMLFSCDLPFGLGQQDGADQTNDQNGGDQNTEPTTPPDYYTVTFDSNGGTDVNPIQVKPGEMVRTPYAPIRAGATFDAWYYEGRIWMFRVDKVNSDITLVAGWIFDEYSITYDLSGGKVVTALPQKYTIETETFTLPAVEKEGSKFAGWYLDGKLVTEIEKGSSGDIYLVADFFGPDASVKDSDTAYARTWDNGDTIDVKLTDDNSAPLTVTVDLTGRPWHTVKIVQNGKTTHTETYTEGDKLLADIEMTPNGSNATLSAAILVGDTTIESVYGTILPNGTKIDANYFPGFVRKSVTFTIDDGDLSNDPTFINIVKPAGIKGTFNLCRTSAASAARYLTLYEGFEVANHLNLHALPIRDGLDFNSLNIKDEYFNSATADVRYVYKTKTPGLYYIDYAYYSTGTPDTSVNHKPYWHPMATYEAYTKDVDATKAAIESVFGEGTVVGFAYPHGILSTEVKEYLKEAGYLYARKTGVLGDSTGFALPADRYAWTYNANVSNLNECMARYDKLDPKGELKFFSFGVHAVDFDGKWAVLKEFANTYGNRQDEFWYASNREIFEYEDAVKALVISENSVYNPSDIDLYITVDDVKTILKAHQTLNFD